MTKLLLHTNTEKNTECYVRISIYVILVILMYCISELTQMMLLNMHGYLLRHWSRQLFSCSFRSRVRDVQAAPNTSQMSVVDISDAFVHQASAMFVSHNNSNDQRRRASIGSYTVGVIADHVLIVYKNKNY